MPPEQSPAVGSLEAWRQRVLGDLLVVSVAVHLGAMLLSVITQAVPSQFLALPMVVTSLHVGLLAWRQGPTSGRSWAFLGSLGAEYLLLFLALAWTPQVVLLAVFVALAGGLLLGARGVVVPLVGLAVASFVGAERVAAGWVPLATPSIRDPMDWWRVAASSALATGTMAWMVRRVVDDLLAQAAEVRADHERLVEEADAEERARADRTLALDDVREAWKLHAVRQLSDGLHRALDPVMAGARMMADALRGGRPLSAEGRQRGRSLRVQLLDASLTLRRLLLLSRRSDLDVVEVDVHRLLRDLAPTLRQALPDGVELELSEGPRATVQADRPRLEQVLLGLVLNARDAVGEAGRVVVSGRTVSLSGSLPEGLIEPLVPGAYAVFEVADDGPGFQVPALGQVTQPFFTTRDPEQHDGLGLFVSQGLARDHGGSLQIRSSREGAKVALWWPLCEERSAPAGVAPATTAVDPVRAEAIVATWRREDAVRMGRVTAVAVTLVHLADVLIGFWDMIGLVVGAVALGASVAVGSGVFRRADVAVVSLAGVLLAVTSVQLARLGFMGPAMVAAHATATLVAAVHARREVAAAVWLVASVSLGLMGWLGPLEPVWHDAETLVTEPGNWRRLAVVLPGTLGVSAVLVLGMTRVAGKTLDERLQSAKALRLARAARQEEERALLTALQVARRASRLAEAGREAGSVAHDLNNALAGLLGWVDMLDDDVLTPAELPEARASIIEAANYAESLLSRLDTSSSEATVGGNVDLRELIERSRGMVVRVLGPGVELATQAGAGCFAPAPYHELQRALLNLASNARDAMPEGGRLLVAASRDEAGVWLEVGDNGCGMTAEDRERVFEAFYTTKAVGLGTGLGLHTVANVVARSGGRVDLHSEVGEGTRVVMYWPEPAVQVA